MANRFTFTTQNILPCSRDPIPLFFCTSFRLGGQFNSFISATKLFQNIFLNYPNDVDWIDWFNCPVIFFFIFFYRRSVFYRIVRTKISMRWYSTVWVKRNQWNQMGWGRRKWGPKAEAPDIDKSQPIDLCGHRRICSMWRGFIAGRLVW